MRCVPSHHFTVDKARAWRSAIAEDPPYQRNSGAWSLDKRQLFIDSLLNGYDVPKIYLHDLRGRHPTRVYAIVDGKQRLTTIWSFLDDEFPLAADFRIEAGDNPDVPPDVVLPVGALRFSQLDPHWQQVLTRTWLSVVLIRDATEEDIEDLFSRLNNGEALNAAERRNALGGNMAMLVREVARRPFFAEHLRFTNARYQHLELATKLLAIEAARRAGNAGPPDLEVAALDAFVREHRHLAEADRAALIDGIDAQIELATLVLAPDDPRLGSPTEALHGILAAVRDPAARRSDQPATRPSAARAFVKRTG